MKSWDEQLSAINKKEKEKKGKSSGGLWSSIKKAIGRKTLGPTITDSIKKRKEADKKRGY